MSREIRKYINMVKNYGRILNEHINEKRYRIVSDYGYGDKSWIERDLTQQDVINWFIKHKNYSIDTEFNELPYYDSDFIYYIEDDHPDDKEDWNWEDS